MTFQIRVRNCPDQLMDLLGISKGFPTPLTSSLMPPKPPRTKVREDAWRKNEICMFIRLLKPSESKKKKENHREGGEVRTPHLNYEKAMMSLSRYEMAMTSLSLSRQQAEGRKSARFLLYAS